MCYKHVKLTKCDAHCKSKQHAKHVRNRWLDDVMELVPNDTDAIPCTQWGVRCHACAGVYYHKNLKRHRESQTHSHNRTVKARRDQERAQLAQGVQAAGAVVVE